MRKLNKYEIIFLSFFTFTVLGYNIFYCHWLSDEAQKSYSFIWNHLFVIALIIFGKSLYETVFTILLSYGIVIFKTELIIYNVALLLVDKENYSTLNTSYDIVLILTGTIFIVVFIAKFFDKICITFNKLLRWISK